VPGAGSYDHVYNTNPTTKFAGSPRMPATRSSTPGPGSFNVRPKWGEKNNGSNKGFSFGTEKRGRKSSTTRSMYEMPGPANYNLQGFAKNKGPKHSISVI